MSDKVYNTLFLCTGNSARSIMAEVLLNSFGHDRFKAFSAGSRPGPHVNPIALDILQATRLSVDGLRSKSWDEFARPGAPQMDFVVTLCDSAAGEECPLWPGQPITAHWGFEDPSASTGTAEEQRGKFDKVFRQIATRIKIFNSLPLATLDKAAIKRELDTLGDRATQASTTAS